MPSKKNGVNTTPAFRNSDDFCQTLLKKNCAFRAFGELIGTAQLSNFDPTEHEGQRKEQVDQLQYGLQMLFNLLITDQEQAIARFQQQYRESDEHILRSASRILQMTEEGAWPEGHIPEETFKKTIADLQTTIAKGGPNKPFAEEMVTALKQSAPPTGLKVVRGAV